MKKIWFQIVVIVLSMAFSYILGIGKGIMSADMKAKESACDTEIIDLIELSIEKDYGVEITSYRCDFEKYEIIFKAENLVFIFKLKKVAPFRYEWVEEENI